ncbi:NAC domain-containing protein 86 [Phtheirospermum japonicum]|uniref:NAC domain-containing protein 86 n=1 Tax=Phtheirospermum japonicum TaxID=374723 RepID=A0A830C961_9LAMI|nr:NAC domain-containing protein 86 [Phtheirospermum japonicum]
MGSIKLEALPKGYRFRPTDEELISHYLRLKINGRHSEVDVIPEVDVCKWEPWDLPALSVIKSDDPEWFFYCPRDKKYPNGHRSNRATEAGYWKATGKDRSIKSRKGHSNTHLIGMKKTLVFHKGRAPKGERTNWIMHEYRTTEPDLDGTGPGQVDYVLCRLFHKADEKLENSKCDDADHTVSFPSTDKSSPDDVSSGLFREPGMLDTQVLKEPEDVKKWLRDEADPVPVESCASDGVDHSGEETALEVYAPLREVSMSGGATYNQFQDSLMSHAYSDLGACVGSPFADNFGSEQNELNFQDGTSEPDASLSELLEGLQKHGNYFGEESTDPRTNLVTREMDKRMVQPQGQISPSYFRVAPSTDHSHSGYGVEADSSANTVNSETGIKIQSRQPRNQPSSSTQGTAPRRIRLGMDHGPKSVCGESSEDGEHESQSLIITEVTEDIDSASNSEESEAEVLNENEESAKKCNSKPSVIHGQNGSRKTRSFMLSTAFSARQGYFKGYAVTVYLVMIVSVVFLGMWICPRSQFASS